MRIGKGKLWLDGSDKVTVPLVSEADGRRYTAVVMNKDVMSNAGPMDLEMRAAVVAEAERVRKDPAQLKRLGAARKRMEKGKAKSRAALKKRILSAKEVAFKASVQDLIQRGTTKQQLFELIREAIVEGVHNG